MDSERTKVFVQEWEKYGNNCMQIAKVLSTQTHAQLKKHDECSSNKIWKQIPRQLNNTKSSSLPIGKHKSWSIMLLNNKNINNLSHLRTKPYKF